MDILQGFSKTEKSKGLNLTIILKTYRVWESINKDLPEDKRHPKEVGILDGGVAIRFESPYEAYFRQCGRMADEYGQLVVDDNMKQFIADGIVDGSGLVGWIKYYNETFPKKKITYVATEDLEPEDFSKEPANQNTDCITFSADDIKSLPDVTFRLKDINRQKELQDVGINVDLLNTGTPDAYLLVSAKEYNDAAVTKIQNAWNNRPERN